jgi:multidrug efflux system membrane fusion protein
MNRFLSAFLPLSILTLAAVLTWWMVAARPQIATQPAERLPPLVRWLEVEKVDLALKVFSQGTVRPRTQSSLVAQVSGEVVYAAPSWADGGFFKEGELLLRMERRDHELALARAQAQVAQAELILSRETEEAEVARREWNAIAGSGAEPTALVLRLPQLAEAKAALAAARAAEEQAKLDLERTEIVAPYEGRIWEKQVDRGQFVSRGTSLARIYAVDAAEVKLPLVNADLAYLDLPLAYSDAPNSGNGGGEGPRVLLRAEFAGREHAWEGRIVRTEGEIDPKSRMLHAVARVERPYGRAAGSDRPPLAVGLFVNAEIEGRTLGQVVVVPRHALRGGDHVLIVGADDRLRIRKVEVLRIQGEEAVLAGGLESGERVCISPLDVVVEGMKVRLEMEAHRPERP